MAIIIGRLLLLLPLSAKGESTLEEVLELSGSEGEV
jgi:hypothetical protein